MDALLRNKQYPVPGISDDFMKTMQPDPKDSFAS